MSQPQCISQEGLIAGRERVESCLVITLGYRPEVRHGVG